MSHLTLFKKILFNGNTEIADGSQIMQKKKFLSPDQEEEHVSCHVSLHVSINLKKFKCERTCVAHTQCAVYTFALAKQWKNKRVGHKKLVEW